MKILIYNNAAKKQEWQIVSHVKYINKKNKERISLDEKSEVKKYSKWRGKKERKIIIITEKESKMKRKEIQLPKMPLPYT